MSIITKWIVEVHLLATGWIQCTEDQLWVESLFSTPQTKTHGNKTFIKRFAK